MGTVNWELTADETQFVQACLRATTKLKNLGDAGGQAGRHSQTAFAKGAKEIIGMATAMTGIGSAVGGVMVLVNQLKAEYQHLRDQQKRAAEAQMSVGAARATAILNKPAGVDTAWLDKLVDTTASDKKVDQKRLWSLAGQMLSSKGALGNAEFAAAFNEAARAGALTGEGMDMSTLGGGLQDVMRITGLKKPAQAGGWIRQIGQQSRIVDLQSQIQAIVPAISSAKPFGWKPEQSAEFMAYLTMMSGDTEGRKSSTGTVSFMEQLDQARTAGGAIIPQRGLGGKMSFRPLKARGAEAIGELQDWYAGADEGLREEFRGKLQGAKKIKGGLLSLIARDPEAMATFRNIQTNITAPSGDGVGGAWDSYFSDVAKGKSEPVRNVKRILDTFVERQKMKNTGGAMAGATRAGLQEALREIPGVSDLAIKGSMAGFEWNSNLGTRDALGAAIGTIGNLQRNYGYGMPYKTQTYGGFQGSSGYAYQKNPNATTTNYSPNPNYDPKQAADLKELVGLLLAEQKALNATLTAKGIKTVIVGDKRSPAMRPAAQTEGQP